MKHLLYHPVYGFMSTDYDEMRDRKISEGIWRDYDVEKETEIPKETKELELLPLDTTSELMSKDIDTILESKPRKKRKLSLAEIRTDD